MDAKHARAFYVARDVMDSKPSYRLLSIDPSVDSARNFTTIAEIRDALIPLAFPAEKTVYDGTPRVSAPIIAPLFGTSATRPGDDDLLLLRRLAGSMYGQSADGGIPAGYTYLGQFVAHEICKSAYVDQMDDEAVNEATFRLDLASLYDSNPRSGSKLEIGETSLTGAPFDIKRTPQGTPQIGNERNDANAALSQMHCAIARFHNALAGCGMFKSFDDIRCQVILCLQAVVLNDWLPRLTSAALVRDILDGRRHSPRGRIRLCPAEVSLAAFRIGHSMVRRDYLGWNDVVGSGASLSGMVRTTHLGGGLINGKLPWNWPLDWRKLFEFDGNPPGIPLKARQIDTIVDEQLDAIDPKFLDTQPHERSLAYRTLWFGARAQLQDGWFIQEQLAGSVGEDEFVLNENNLPPSSGVASELFQTGQPLARRPPLWWFILREAEVAATCGGVAGVGARLLAETVIAAIEANDVSILKGHEPARGLPGSIDLPPTMANLLQWGDQPLDWYTASYR